MPDELRQLIRRCLAGQQPDMMDLVERFHGQVFGLCYRMLGHREDAEDVAQESFVRALRSLRNWDEQRDFLPWLLAIVGNRCRTLLAVRSRRPATCAYLDEIPDRDPGREAADNLAEEVLLALRGLRAEYRQAFVLFHEQEMSYAEIGQAMGCPIGTVKTWVHRARRELIKQLQERGNVEEFRNAVR